MGYASDTDSDGGGEDNGEGEDSESELTPFEEQGDTDQNTGVKSFGACTFQTSFHMPHVLNNDPNAEPNTAPVTIRVLCLNEANMYDYILLSDHSARNHSETGVRVFSINIGSLI